MSNPHPGKRQRTEEPLTVNATKIEIWEALTRLDPSFTQQLLFRIAMSQPRVASEIWESYQSELQKERTKVLDFGIHAEEVETALNGDYDKLGGSKQFEKADDVIDQILRSITAIQDESTKASASFGTRRSGLETLRNIGEIICTSNGVIPHEVVKSFQHDQALEDAMTAIVTCMTLDERRTMTNSGDGTSTFRERLQDLIADAKEFNLFKRLGGVLGALCAGQSASNQIQPAHGGDSQTRDHIPQTRPAPPPNSDYYANLQASFTGIAKMNQFTAAHNSQPHIPTQGAHLPAMRQLSTAHQYAPAAQFPSPSTSTSTTSLTGQYQNPVMYQPQPQHQHQQQPQIQRRPQPQPHYASPHAANAYYSAPPYQPALGSLATRQYSATPPPYQVDPRYTGVKYPPAAAQSQLASQQYSPEQYWQNRTSYQPPGQQ